MIISGRDHPQITITIKDMSFEKVYNFKYLGVGINPQADCHEEKHEIITAINKC